MKKTCRQPALALFSHCSFIGFSLMGLSLSQEEAGWEGSHKTKASQLMNAAPGGKGHRSGSCSWSRRAELAFDSLARTGSLLAGRGNVRAASSAIHPSGPTHVGRDRGLQPRRWLFPHLGSSPQHLAGGKSQRSVSCNHLPTNVQCCLRWGDFAPLSSASFCPEDTVTNPSVFPPVAHVL